MSYYIFKISYYSEQDYIEKKTCGLVSADSYPKALEAITKDWGEDNICSVDFLMPIETIADTLVLNEAMYNMFLMGHNECDIDSYHLNEKDCKGKAYYDFPEGEQ